MAHDPDGSSLRDADATAGAGSAGVDEPPGSDRAGAHSTDSAGATNVGAGKDDVVDAAHADDVDTGNAAAGSGNADVDRALARLSELEGLRTTDHVAVYEDVHERLQRVLSDLDET